MTTTITCADCERQIIIDRKTAVTSPYVVLPDGSKLCHQCSAECDREYMHDTGKNTLYLTEDDDGAFCVQNYSGTLRFYPFDVKTGAHNITGQRTDLWFTFEQQVWHGVCYSTMSQECQVKRTKVKAVSAPSYTIPASF
jgi:hypothetical protein